MELEILYQDEFLVAINKPAGLLVHRSPLAKDATEFALQTLRDQLRKKVFLAHRLDRKTSGVLLFSLNADVNKLLQLKFTERKIKKSYLAIVRGFLKEEGKIEYPLENERGTLQAAITFYKTLKLTEINLAFGKHPTSRYSFVELTPETGRFHQLRKHLSHISHPIIGDRPHGCNKQNRLWKEKWGVTRMLLHATSLEFEHPVLRKEIKIEAGFDEDFSKALKVLS